MQPWPSHQYILLNTSGHKRSKRRLDAQVNTQSKETHLEIKARLEVCVMKKGKESMRWRKDTKKLNRHLAMEILKSAHGRNHKRQRENTATITVRGEAFSTSAVYQLQMMKHMINKATKSMPFSLILHTNISSGGSSKWASFKRLVSYY